jgi:hypothetical protein
LEIAGADGVIDLGRYAREILEHIIEVRPACYLEGVDGQYRSRW